MTGVLYGGVQGFWVRTYIIITTDNEQAALRKDEF